MRKIIITAIMASCFAVSAFAMSPDTDSFSGIYMGVDAGYQFGKNDLAQYDHNAKQPTTNLRHDKKHSGAFGLHFGGGKQFNSFYLGAELGANYATNEQTSTMLSQLGHPLIVASRPSYSMNLDLIPGVAVTKRFLTFLRLGMGYSDYALDVDYRPGDPAHEVHVNETKHYFAYRAGVGFKYLVNDNCTLGFSYVRVQPTSSIKYHVAPSGGHSFHYDVKPARNVFMLSVSYLINMGDSDSDMQGPGALTNFMAS
ncbi:MAG: outer membrane beta-barrel protein [Gammaproteobacteria bacterium]|nr:outer membrane beta-barrel protein [Gammaproteobacteria bacterium]